MNELDSVISMMKHQIGLSSQRNDIAKIASASNNLTGLRGIYDIGKNIREKLSPFSASQDFIRSFQLNKNFAPSSVVDAITSITRQHIGFYTKWNSVVPAAFMGYSQMNSLQSTLKALSLQAATLSLKNHNWDLLQDFEEISEEAVSISERVIDQQVLTKKDINDIKAFMERIEIKVDKFEKKDATVEAIIYKWITIISFILTLLAEARVWMPKPEAATKEDLEFFRKDILLQLDSKLKQREENKITIRRCKVFYKPKKKSRIIATLEKESDVIILSNNSKWVYISFINSQDNLAETGWVLKKYLSQKK